MQQVDDLRAVEVHEEAGKGPVHILGGSQGDIKKNIIEILIIRIKLSEEGGFKTKALKMDFFRNFNFGNNALFENILAVRNKLLNSILKAIKIH